MPNRIIKESICYSDDIDQLSPFEETVFYRLIVSVDDYGRIDARPSFLRSKLFATKKGITEKNVEDAVSKLSTIGLVRCYRVAGKSFLLLTKWVEHQRVRDSKAKYPAPSETDDENDELPQVAASCREHPQDAARAGAESKSESQSESQSISESESNNNAHPRSSKSAHPGIEKEFDELWELYPRKQGKQKALAAYKTALKSGASFDLVRTGIEAYLHYISVKRTDEKYIKHGSTWFVGQHWKDRYECEPEHQSRSDENPFYKLLKERGVDVDDI